MDTDPAWLMPRVKFGTELVKRCLRLLKVLFPGWTSLSMLLFATLLVSSLLQQVLIYYTGLIPSQYYTVLGDKNLDKFKLLAIQTVLIILANSFVKSTSNYISSMLYLTWRNNTCRYLHALYFRGIAYYQVNVISHHIDNPDQRMTQDVDKMCSTLSMIAAQLLITPFIIAYYVYQAYTGTGFLGPVSVLVFFIIATIINKFLMSPVVDYVYKQERMEGDFRYKHMHIRSNAESAAFYRSAVVEEMKSNECLDRLLQTQQRLVRWQYALNFSINSFDYLGGILSYMVVAFPIFIGTYDHFTPVELSSFISKNAFVTIYLINCFTQLIDMSLQATQIAGTAHRIGELMETLQNMKCDKAISSQPSPPSTPSTELTVVASDSSVVSGEMVDVAYSIENVSYSAPNSGDMLVKDLDLKICPGINMLVTGSSGCGKSSLLRVLCGLWPPTKGNVFCNVTMSPHGILFLPQKPYFTNGTLRDQIAYPLLDSAPDAACDEKILNLLNQVGLSSVVERLGGLDCLRNFKWYDKLSPGEMQRISFVRLFFHHPPFAVLDEATSQMDQETEEVVYTLCKQFNITVVSVAHRESLRAHHDIELNIQGDGQWSVTNIR